MLFCYLSNACFSMNIRVEIVACEQRHNSSRTMSQWWRRHRAVTSKRAKCQHPVHTHRVQRTPSAGARQRISEAFMRLNRTHAQCVLSVVFASAEQWNTQSARWSISSCSFSSARQRRATASRVSSLNRCSSRARGMQPSNRNKFRLWLQAPTWRYFVGGKQTVCRVLASLSSNNEYQQSKRRLCQVSLRLRVGGRWALSEILVVTGSLQVESAEAQVTHVQPADDDEYTLSSASTSSTWSPS